MCCVMKSDFLLPRNFMKIAPRNFPYPRNMTNVTSQLREQKSTQTRSAFPHDFHADLYATVFTQTGTHYRPVWRSGSSAHL